MEGVPPVVPVEQEGAVEIPVALPSSGVGDGPPLSSTVDVEQDNDLEDMEGDEHGEQDAGEGLEEGHGGPSDDMEGSVNVEDEDILRRSLVPGIKPFLLFPLRVQDDGLHAMAVGGAWEGAGIRGPSAFYKREVFFNSFLASFFNRCFEFVFFFS